MSCLFKLCFRCFGSQHEDPIIQEHREKRKASFTQSVIKEISSEFFDGFVCVVDGDGVIVNANHHIETLMGTKRAKGKSLLEFIHDDHCKEVAHLIRRVFEENDEQKLYKATLPLVGGDVDAGMVANIGIKGGELYIMMTRACMNKIGSDIELEKIKLLVERSENTGYFLVDSQGIIRDVVDTSVRCYLGYSARQLVGLNMNTLTWPDDQEIADDPESFRGMSNEAYSFRRKHKNGSFILTEMVEGVYEAKSGELYRIIIDTYLT